MCANRMCKYGLYYELHRIEYSPISFISSVDVESASSGTHGVGGLEAVQRFIQDYQLLVQVQYYPNACAHTLHCVHVHQHYNKIGKLLYDIQYLSIILLALPVTDPFPTFRHCTGSYF